MNDHDELLDSVALLALGVLPEAEARMVAEHARECAQDVAAHAASCERCRTEYAELRAAADAVGYAAELGPGELDEVTAALMKSRLMRAVAASAAAASREVPSAPPRPVLGPGRGRSAWLPYGAAAAAVLLAAVTSLDNAALRKQLDREHVAATEAATFQARVAAALGPGSKFYAVPAGEVVISGGHVILAIRNLPALGPGKVYQAWTLRSGARAMAPSVTFAPAAGSVTLVELPEPAQNLSAVALSVEPAGGSKAPTSTPVFVRKLS